MKKSPCAQPLPKWNARKAMRRAALASLFCAVLSASSQTNWWSGTAFGTNLAEAVSIGSLTAGTGALVIGFSNTAAIAINHDIEGFIAITNQAPSFTLVSTNNSTLTGSQGAVLTVLGATNLVVEGGRFIGTTGLGDGDYPPIPGVDETAAFGGLIRNSAATIVGSEFAGAPGLAGLAVEAGSSLAVSNGLFRGGDGTTGNGGTALRVLASDVEIFAGGFAGGAAGGNPGAYGGAALFAGSNSTVKVHDGSFTGRVGNTAFYLQDSDAAIYGGTFAGNGGGSRQVAGDGLFSELTGATTNKVELHGGTFSSLAFYGAGGSVQDFLAGTNLVVGNGIIQNGGTVQVENRSNTALQKISVFDGTMAFANDFALASNGVFRLESADGRAGFSANLEVGADALLHVGSGRVNVATNFTLAGGGTLAFTVAPDAHGVLAADGSATFGTNALIRIDATQAGFGAGTTNLALVAAADISDGGLEVEATTVGRVVYGGFALAGNSNLLFQFNIQSLADYWNATGQLGRLGAELETIGNTEMLNAIDRFDDPAASSAAVEQAYFAAFNTFQTALQGQRALVGQAASRGSDFREQLKLLPTGAKGLDRRNDLRGWGKYYGQYFTHDRDGLNPAYETVLHGGVAGADASAGNLLAGFAGGASGYRTRADSDAEQDTTAYHGNLYATYGMERGYLDAGLAYSYHRVETRTADPFRLEGEFDAHLAGAYFGGGYDLVDTKGGTVFTPEASIQYAYYAQEDYEETGRAAVPRRIDGFNAYSILGSVGMNVSMLDLLALRTFGLKLEGRFHWMREFNPDPGGTTFVLEGGQNRYRLACPSLDEDIFRAGLGCTFFNTLRNKPKNVLFRVDFDELFGNGFNAHNLSAKLVYAF